ncbi:MAG: response regulator transcription factor [Clostridia bacterium]|nr:response regulator transcription factor [Clostridia bacterium]
MKSDPVILVADDDVNISHLVQLYLEKEGFAVQLCHRGDDALTAFRKMPPDLVLLDVMMPGMDGWQVLRQIRRSSEIPIIMLTAKDETVDKVVGLELGADDYITKPFDPKELVARVKAVLRRARGVEENSEDTLVFPALTVSLTRYECYYEGHQVEMPPRELEVLYFLCQHAGQVFTRDQLLDEIWGFDFVGESSRTVDVHIKRVREKLPDCEKHGWTIRTVYGVGYKFEVK